jgi:hypothetical protein
MFKILLQYNCDGDFIDTVFDPMEYSRAVAILTQLRRAHGGTHNYIMVEDFQDTPLAEAYGG